MVYLKSVENVITLGKLIGLLFLFCLPLLSILFLKTKRNDLARPVMGTIFLVTYLPSLVPRPLYARGARFLPRRNKDLVSTLLAFSLNKLGQSLCYYIHQYQYPKS